MTALPSPHEPLVLDLSQTQPAPYPRLVGVEIRKMVDTRAGLWLLISTGMTTLLVLIAQLWVGAVQEIDLDFRSFMLGMNTPMGILLPVIGVLAVTQEWSQRTALVTFTQVPSRLTVFAAKFGATMLVALAAVVTGLVLATIANLLFAAITGNPAVWGVGAAQLAGYFLLHAFGLATGFAFGTLFLNSPVAIVVYFVYSFVLPGLFSLGSFLMDWFANLQPWIDFNAAQAPLLDGTVGGRDWAHLAVSGLLWLVLPLVVGLWRVLRAEVK